MKTFTVPSFDDLSPAAKAALEPFKKATGKVPNLYATIGYSGNALSSYIAFSRAQAKGSFHAKDREAVYLIVSQINGCQYCLAAHTASALKNGWTEEQTLQLRAGTLPDKKWQVLYKMILSIIENKGAVPDDILDEFFGQGFKEPELMDLMALIITMSYANYVYRLTKIPIDFPLAKPIA